MAIAFVNATALFNAGSATTVVSSAFNLTATNLTIVSVRFGTTSNFVLSMTDTAGNIYRQAGKIRTVSLAGQEVWYCANCAGNASNAVTATFNAADSSRGIAVAQFSGLATVSPLDVLINDAKSSGANITSSAFTTAVADEVVVACFTIAATGSTWTASGGYTVAVQDASNVQAILYQIFSSIQTGVTVTGTETDASQKCMITSSYNATLGGGGGAVTVASVF
jgi:hypothetical protein